MIGRNDGPAVIRAQENAREPEQRKELVELKPCPFCGGSGLIEAISKGFYRVRCMKCGATSVAHDSGEEAAEKWNTRIEAIARSEASDELADDVRFIAAHTADPRNEEKLYEAADRIAELEAVLRSTLPLIHPDTQVGKSIRATLTPEGE